MKRLHLGKKGTIVEQIEQVSLLFSKGERGKRYVGFTSRLQSVLSKPVWYGILRAVKNAGMLKTSRGHEMNDTSRAARTNLGKQVWPGQQCNTHPSPSPLPLTGALFKRVLEGIGGASDMSLWVVLLPHLLAWWRAHASRTTPSPWHENLLFFVLPPYEEGVSAIW